MAEEEARKIRMKLQASSASLLTSILSEKEVRLALIKFALPAILLFIGALSIYLGVRAALHWGYVGDIVVGLILTALALVCIKVKK